MAVVLKVAAGSDVHRLRLEVLPTYEALDAILRDLWPSASGSGGCSLARYTDEDGDLCRVTRATFPDFLETARMVCGGVCPVLRLEVPARPRAPSQALAGEGGPGVQAGRSGGSARHREEQPPAASRSASPASSWLCIDAARERSDSGDESSWVYASAREDGSGAAAMRSRSDSSERVSFEPIGLQLAELHQDDWGSCTSGSSQPLLPPAVAQVASEAAGTAAEKTLGQESAASEVAASEASFSVIDDDAAEGQKEAEEEAAAAELAHSPAEVHRQAQALEAAAACPVDAAPAAVPAAPPASSKRLGSPSLSLDALDLEVGLGALLQEEADLAGLPTPPMAPKHAGKRLGAEDCKAEPIRGLDCGSFPAKPPLARVQRPRSGLSAARHVRKLQGLGVDKVVHMGHICDGCEACPLPGPRFACKVCVDFDLCWTCYMQRDKLPEPHDHTHLFQQVLWSQEVVPACPGGCGFGVTSCSGHPTHCCTRCAEGFGQHTDECHLANAHDEELEP